MKKRTTQYGSFFAGTTDSCTVDIIIIITIIITSVITVVQMEEEE